MEHLKDDNIVFTEREADVIACLISGNTSKSIADILSISPNTANVHIRNVIQKINGASKNDLVKYIEQSSQYKTFRDRYDNLIRLKKFHELLKKILKISVEKKICYIKFNEEKEEYTRLISCLKEAGIDVYTWSEDSKSKDCIYIICSENFSKISLEKNIIVFTKNAKNTLLQNVIEYKEDVQGAILKCIGRIYVENAEIQSLISGFFPNISEKENIANSAQKISSSKIIKYKKYFLAIISIIVFGFVFFISTKLFHDKAAVKSNMPVIFKDVFLERTDIEEKIEQAFGDDKIKVAVLVGYGGTGKTTIARHYLKSQKYGITFEINAESQNSLYLSLYKIASLLAVTPSQRDEISFIKNIDTDDVKKIKLLHFISSQLKQAEGWCILFDNVDDFSIIADCFPHDPEIWGSGKVIITTRNFNAEDVTFLNPKSIIKIGRLNAEEKAKLFNNIVGKNIPNSEVLLKSIPSMPLDVTIAAHYIKTCKISAEDYLKTLHNAKFDSFKKSLLKNITGYNQTRYSIVTTSFEKLIKENSINKELLLMLSMLSPERISKWYFLRYCDEATVDSFILNLKQYSLAHTKGSKIFVHRSTQEIGQKYLLNLIPENERDKIIGKIVDAMTPYECLMWYSYNNQERQLSYKEINAIIPHLESLKNTINSMPLVKSEKEKYIVRIMLALLYAYVPESNEQKMRKLSEEIIQRNKGFIKGYDLAALFLEHTYCGIGSLSDKDEKYLKKSIELCTQLKANHLLAITYIYLSLYFSEKKEIELCRHFLRESMKLANEIKTRMLLNYRYCEVSLSLCSSKKELEEVINYTLETLKILGASHFFYKTKEKYGDRVEGASKNCIAALRRILVRIYNSLGMYDDAIENYNEAFYFYEKRKENGNRIPVKRETALDIEHANTLLRVNKISESKDKLEQAIKVKVEHNYNHGLFQAFIYKAEADLRLGKLNDAYGDCLNALKYKDKSEAYSIHLLHMRLYYIMAIAKYKFGDSKKAIECFKMFINLAKIWFSNRSDNSSGYEGTLDEEIFSTSKNTRIEDYFKHCSKIFTEIYGREHSFVKNFVETINI